MSMLECVQKVAGNFLDTTLSQGIAAGKIYDHTY